jgi:hypothetical protein
MASKGINIKVSRTKIIDALKNKLSEIEIAQEKYLQDVETHKQDRQNWIDGLFKIAVKNPELKTEIETRDYWGNKDFLRLTVEYSIPRNIIKDEPVEPKNPISAVRHGRNFVSDVHEQIAELSNAIRMLELSDEEVVSTATYASVAKYL